MTLEQVFEIVEAKPENVLSDDQKAKIRFLDSRGFMFLVQFFLHELDKSYWAVFDFETKGALIQ